MMKKLLSAMASLALLTGACAMPVSAEETYLLGDVNADGVVDVRDAQKIVGYFNRAVILNTEHMWTEEQYAAADVNADGVVDTSDAACVLDYCVKRIITKGSQNSDIYFAKVAAGVEDYSLGDVNMDGVVDSIDAAEVLFAENFYTKYNREVPHWSPEQYVLADITDRCDNDEELGFGEINFIDSTILHRYCMYSVVVAEPVEPEVFYQSPGQYLTNEIIQEAEQYEELSQALLVEKEVWAGHFNALCEQYGQCGRAS